MASQEEISQFGLRSKVGHNGGTYWIASTISDRTTFQASQETIKRFMARLGDFEAAGETTGEVDTLMSQTYALVEQSAAAGQRENWDTNIETKTLVAHHAGWLASNPTQR